MTQTHSGDQDQADSSGDTSGVDEVTESASAKLGESAASADAEAQPAQYEASSTLPIDPALISTPSKGREIVGRLFDSRGKIAAWVVGLVAVVAVVVGGLLLSSYLEQKAEERAAAVAQFESKEAVFDERRSELKSQLSDAKELLASTTTDQVSDAAVLDELQAAIDSAFRALQTEQPAGSDQIRDWSTEEITEGGAQFLDAVMPLTEASDELVLAVDGVEASIEEKRAADAAAARQTKINSAGPISFEELARGGESLTGNYYRFEGEVIQDAGSGAYRVSITREAGYSRDYWKDPILVYITGDTSQRLLEHDIISFVGVSAGMQSYETVLGAEVTLPMVLVEGQHVSVTGRTS